jgi:two-component system, LytTR family, sensor kinase
MWAFLAATLIGLLFAAQWVLASAAVGRPVEWSYVLAWVLPEWLLWAALAPVVFAIARRFPVRRATWRRVAPVHVLAAVALAGVHAVAFAMVTWPLPWADIAHVPLPVLARTLVGKKGLSNLLVYALLAGAAHAIAARLRASLLESQLARAQIAALRLQLHPHFLFNALHTLSELIHRDPRAADRMVTRLGDLLRAILDGDGVEAVPLRRELELLERYVDIERVRFHDRLTVDIDAAPDCLDACVPYLVLQPLVENAIRHGIAARPGAGRVELSARRDGDDLIVVVRDDGAGLGGGGSPTGIGLRNSRARLEALGGRLTVADRESGGVEARVALPFRTSP